MYMKAEDTSYQLCVVFAAQ